MMKLLDMCGVDVKDALNGLNGQTLLDVEVQKKVIHDEANWLVYFNYPLPMDPSLMLLADSSK